MRAFTCSRLICISLWWIIFCISEFHQFQPRETISLDGLWKFKISPHDDQEAGFREAWFSSNFEDYIDMPVPSSFNDITVNRTIRDYIGWVWYQRTFRLPASMQNGNLLRLRFTSIHYYCKVWVDGYYSGEHEGGHVPFELNWPSEAMTNKEKTQAYPTFFITVAVNNTLNNWSIPQGKLVYPNNTNRYPPGYFSYSHDFDYFDYAGINGHVLVYSYKELITSVEIFTSYHYNGTGYVQYNVTHTSDKGICQVTLKDDLDNVVAQFEECVEVIFVPKAQPWWPAHCGQSPVGYLYSLQILLLEDTENPNIVDMYEMKIGIRTIKWNKMSLFINNVRVYLRGFGMHQDAEMRGRGFDLVQTTKDMNLLEWIGANAVRTSHYPYPKEFVEFADRRGIMIIMESPACSLSNFDDTILARHKEVMTEIYKEFGNHASIIMWSLANEPMSNKNESDIYFEILVSHMKAMDISRPVTFVTSQMVENDKAVKHVDIICLNRYNAWYSDGGQLELIQYQTIEEIKRWFHQYQRPLIYTEYGAGALAGLHALPSTMWSENYQVDIVHEHFNAFDAVKKLGFFIGEMMWNFADFHTPQGYIRPGGCMKGAFTRNRQPKSVAYALKRRFERLSKKFNSRYEWPEIMNFYDNENTN
ncbi:beta-glucuronidase-like isoform X2 [Rhodnius prolixus]|uniref:beta-glucuronidase-like isoform X2 n=1 Tax=Rhodnius prolixus TaxID=13249 RepID=UPI003D18F309